MAFVFVVVVRYPSSDALNAAVIAIMVTTLYRRKLSQMLRLSRVDRITGCPLVGALSSMVFLAGGDEERRKSQSPYFQDLRISFTYPAFTFIARGRDEIPRPPNWTRKQNTMPPRGLSAIDKVQTPIAAY